MAIASRGSLIIADAIVIAVTWVRLSSSVKEALSVIHWRAATISRTMLVDGEKTNHPLVISATNPNPSRRHILQVIIGIFAKDTMRKVHFDVDSALRMLNVLQLVKDLYVRDSLCEHRRFGVLMLFILAWQHFSSFRHRIYDTVRPFIHPHTHFLTIVFLHARKGSK